MDTCTQLNFNRLYVSFAVFGLLLLILFPQTVRSNPLIPAVVLNPYKTNYSFAGKLAYFEDQHSRLSFFDIKRKAAQGAFHLLNQDNIIVDNTKSTIWLKFSVENHALLDQNWLLLFNHPLFDKLEIFSKEEKGRWHSQLLGNSLPFKQRSIDHRIFVSKLKIALGKNKEFYVRVKVSSFMQLRIEVISEEEFFSRELANEMLYGVIYGIMVLMAVYNLFFYFAIRNKSYLVYIFSVLSGCLFIMSVNGHAYQYLWPENPRFATTVIPLSFSLWVFFSAIFTQVFLETKYYASRLYYAVNFLIACSVFSLIVSLLGENQLAIITTIGLALVNTTLILSASVVCWLNGNNSFARFFVAAWSVYGLGVVVSIFNLYGVIPGDFVSYNSATLGLLFEMIFLSLALSDKYRVLAIELESYAIELETKVKLRTLELEISNRKLKGQSLSDGLTGLPNRRSFDQQLELEWKRLLREAKPLSLLVCDVDEFKNINDHFGHQYGDQCLQTISQLINQSIHRSSDVASRIGGDEFTIILPDTDIIGAELLGKRICKKVERAAIAHAPDALYEVVTMSIGAATLIPNRKRNIKQLFSLADTNLYRAKEHGRNRVVASTSENLIKKLTASPGKSQLI